MRKHLAREWQYHAMLIPGFIVTLIFCYFPLYGLVIAFQKYNPALGFSSPWIGFKNFEYIFSQPNFLKTIWNTFYISFFKIVGGIIVPVVVALLLNEVRRNKFKRLFQSLVYIPNFLSWVIMAGLLMDILARDGIVSNLLVAFGVGPINLLGDPSIFPWMMIISDIWKGFGFGTVVYLAALTSIDPSLYESAMIDGASRWRQTLSITLPMLTPIILLMMTLSLGSVLDAGFDQIFNLYSPIVYETGDIIDTYMYRMGIEQAQYSVGAAVGLFKSGVSCVLIGLSIYLASKFAGYKIF